MDTSSTRRSAICGESSTTRAFITSSSRRRVWNSALRAAAPWAAPPLGVGVLIVAALRDCRSCAAMGSDSSISASGDQLVLHRVVGDVGVRLEIHLLEDARAIGA